MFQGIQMGAKIPISSEEPRGHEPKNDLIYDVLKILITLSENLL